VTSALEALALSVAMGAAMTCVAVGAAIHHARLAQQRGRELERWALRERDAAALVRRLADASHASLVATQTAIVDAARAAVPQAHGLLLFAAGAAELVCVRTAGEPATYFAGTRIALDDLDALPVRALVSGHRVAGADRRARATHGAAAHAFAVPMMIDERGRAVIEVFGAGAFSDAEVARVAVVCEFGALAWRVAVERERDRRRAEHDALTGLLTPAELRRRLARIVARASGNRTARFALLFVDTDRFKEWNDAHGHAAGDALLREIAALLRGFARSSDDLVARNGGDEFCLVFSETEKADAIERAETVRAGFAALHFPITASIGVAAYPLDGRDAAGLLERADAAMYYSKRAGRDAVAYIGVDGSLVATRGGTTLPAGDAALPLSAEPRP
jgi:diguanylate cyclase (GGDEF)-like protein